MEQAPFVVTDGVPNLAAMKNTSFVLTEPVNDNGTLYGIN